MQKALLISVTGVLFLVFVTIAQATSSIKLVINGQQIDTAVPVQVIQGRILVPLRTVAESLGAEVRWAPAERTVRVDTNPKQDLQCRPVKLRGGELSLGAIPKDVRFILPVLATLNQYLANKQVDSLSSSEGVVLTKYELLEAAYTTGGMGWYEDTAYEVAVRLYYSDSLSNPGLIKLYEETKPDGVHGGVENPQLRSAWYEDVVFTVRPVKTNVITEGCKKTWVQGEGGWVVDAGTAKVLKKVMLKKEPILFDITYF